MVKLCLFSPSCFPNSFWETQIIQSCTKWEVKAPHNPAPSCDFELSLQFCSRNAEMFHIGSAERLSNTMPCEGAGPPGSWFREKAMQSHFLTISATGSGHQTVLAPKGAAPTGGQRALASFYHCFEGQAKNSRKRTTRGYLHPQPKKEHSEAKSGCSFQIFTSP